MQNWSTPTALLTALQKRFGPIVFDLAAEAHNHVHPRFFTKEEDALKQDWSALYKVLGGSGWLFLNPPFSDMKPWVEKCAEEGRKGAKIVLLSKVSIAEWFVDYVAPNAAVFLLSPRVKYVPPPGEERNPETGKLRTGADFDSMLSLFGPATRGQIEVWRWRL